jgi:hypothetical protein
VGVPGQAVRIPAEHRLVINQAGITHYPAFGGVFTKLVSRRQPMLELQGQELCAARIEEWSGQDRERTDVLLRQGLESLLDFAITANAEDKHVQV